MFYFLTPLCYWTGRQGGCPCFSSLLDHCPIHLKNHQAWKLMPSIGTTHSASLVQLYKVLDHSLPHSLQILVHDSRLLSLQFCLLCSIISFLWLLLSLCVLTSRWSYTLMIPKMYHYLLIWLPPGHFTWMSTRHLKMYMFKIKHLIFPIPNVPFFTASPCDRDFTLCTAVSLMPGIVYQ